MYSNKTNVNILTALLIRHGVRHAVVCPGSRNAPITHNLQECGATECHPITDERSAAFFALGIIQATGEPVALCVTSGSALLNTASAVSEAYYQHLPLIVISADRPAAWIDQNDGQTIRQHGALANFVKYSTTLPEPRNDEERWHCNRLVNEALLAATHRGRGPVHINVPLSEPLYDFSVKELPTERVIHRYDADTLTDVSALPLVEAYANAKRPMIVVGQNGNREIAEYILDELSRHCAVIGEPLGLDALSTPFDDALAIIGNDADYRPDLIIYVGGMLVSKRLKQFLRQCGDAEQWRIAEDGDITDTFCHLTGIVEAKVEPIMQYLAFSSHLKKNTFARRWNDIIRDVEEELMVKTSIADALQSGDEQNDKEQLSSEVAVKYLETKAKKLRDGIHFHYANSTAVRLACRHARHHVFCNRGVNGIDGSLSTAAGYSVATDDKVVCVIGDLSFFYDANALWNKRLGGNLRILLLNDGGGAIFRGLPGFDAASASADFISGTNHATAQGICESYGAKYISAHDFTEMSQAIDTLLTAESDCPMLVEILLK